MKVILILQLILVFIFSSTRSPNLEPTFYSVTSQAMYFATMTYEESRYIQKDILEKYVNEGVKKDLTGQADLINIQYYYYLRNNLATKVKITISYYQKGIEKHSKLVMCVI